MTMDWDTYYIGLTYEIARKSKDPSTKVGAIIVGVDWEIRTTGYNSFPRKLNDNVAARYTRPLKYQFFEHAERNAIYNAARIGVSCKGATLYVQWHPCSDCARGIIQSGITDVVLHSENPNNNNPRWRTSIALASEMLRECGVRLWWWSGGHTAARNDVAAPSPVAAP